VTRFRGSIALAELHLTASFADTLNATTPLFTALVVADWQPERLTGQKVGAVDRVRGSWRAGRLEFCTALGLAHDCSDRNAGGVSFVRGRHRLRQEESNQIIRIERGNRATGRRRRRSASSRRYRAIHRFE